MKRGVAGWVAALAATAAAAAEPAIIKWDAQGAASTMLALKARSEYEVCEHLKPGQRIVWAFVAQTPVDFTIRALPSREVVSGAPRTGVREARDALEPRRESDYCWVWINRTDQPTQVSVQLRR